MSHYQLFRDGSKFLDDRSVVAIPMKAKAASIGGEKEEKGHKRKKRDVFIIGR